MDVLIREGSQIIPKITFNPAGKIDISGRSIHEDPKIFFDPLCEWIENYCKNPPEITNVNIELEYFNSGSARYILKILRRLGRLIDDGKKLIINWHFEEGDDDILERGEYYASILKTTFNFIES